MQGTTLVRNHGDKVMMRFALKMSILALPVLLIAGPVDAQTKKASKSGQMSEQEYLAREKCIALAQQEKQSGDEAKASTNRRSTIYTDCIRKAGYRY
jgi:hypothetical protein